MTSQWRLGGNLLEATSWRRQPPGGDNLLAATTSWRRPPGGNLLAFNHVAVILLTSTEIRIWMQYSVKTGLPQREVLFQQVSQTVSIRILVAMTNYYPAAKCWSMAEASRFSIFLPILQPTHEILYNHKMGKRLLILKHKRFSFA